MYKYKKHDGEQYKVEKGSGSGHCCFNGTVYDTFNVWENQDGDFISYKIICECADFEDAEIICLIMNSYT